MSDIKHEMTREERPYPYDGNGCGGTQEGWSVEARYVSCDIKRIGDQTFDSRWRTINFYNSPIGVPSGADNCLDRYSALMRLLPYESAQALRWWFIAELNRDGFGALCMETRLVKHEVQYKLSSRAISAHDNLGGDNAKFDTRRPIDMQGNGRKA